MASRNTAITIKTCWRETEEYQLNRGVKQEIPDEGSKMGLSINQDKTKITGFWKEKEHKIKIGQYQFEERENFWYMYNDK